MSYMLWAKLYVVAHLYEYAGIAGLHSDTPACHFGPRRRYLDQVWQVKGQVQLLKHTWERIAECVCVNVWALCGTEL